MEQIWTLKQQMIGSIIINLGGLVEYMNIPIKMNKDFERALSTIDAKYGEDFEILNGFNESQLNFSDFIDGFVDKNVADVTIDSNANAHHKDICSMLGEKGKSEDKLFAFNKIFYELKKKYGLRTAKDRKSVV